MHQHAPPCLLILHIYKKFKDNIGFRLDFIQDPKGCEFPFASLPSLFGTVFGQFSTMSAVGDGQYSAVPVKVLTSVHCPCNGTSGNKSLRELDAHIELD